MANVNLSPKALLEAPSLEVNEAKDGLHYDDCPCCGNRDIEPHFKNVQGEGAKEQADWSLYHDDCGYSWSRTTGAGAAKNEARGQNTKWLTSSANKLTTMPGMSRAYCDGYDRIANHGEPLKEFASPYRRS